MLDERREELVCALCTNKISDIRHEFQKMNAAILRSKYHQVFTSDFVSLQLRTKRVQLEMPRHDVLDERKVCVIVFL